MTALLAFDTSGERMHVGLGIGARTWLHESAGGARASADLVPAILALLARAGTRLADLDAIAFGRGPGAFTGLRTACSVAQGMALGAAKPVLAIDTLMAVAEDARQGAQQLQVWAVIDARMDQIYAAHYLYERGRWSVLVDPFVTGVEDLNETWRESAPQHAAGNALSAFAARLECRPEHCHALAVPRAAALLALAQAHWVQGAALDAGAATPSYVRDKVAQTVAERSAGRRLRDAWSGSVK
ncbi:MAG: tRNA (adenosine(37)-N6)-threonylcarbamoyltransferase complex dimerization subunit type 1 TsaB [Burkholderiaceae bacterium]